MNFRVGLTRLLIVASAVYWLIAIGDAASEYHQAAGAALPAGAWVVEAANGQHYEVLPPGGATPAIDCARATALAKARMRMDGVPTEVKGNACATLISAAARVRSRHGVTAAARRLIGWGEMFAVLAGALLVVRWVWRGFQAVPSK